LDLSLAIATAQSRGFITSNQIIGMLRVHLFSRQPLLKSMQPFFLLVQNNGIITIEGSGPFCSHVMPEVALPVSECRIVMVRHDPVDDREWRAIDAPDAVDQDLRLRGCGFGVQESGKRLMLPRSLGFGV
jgi:hypothetical protein